MVLKSAAPHAWLYEHGSVARHTKLGRPRGVMPGNPVFVRNVIKFRRQMWQNLATMMKDHGLGVTLNAA